MKLPQFGQTSKLPRKTSKLGIEVPHLDSLEPVVRRTLEDGMQQFGNEVVSDRRRVTIKSGGGA
jgi:hypothetical protein